MYVETPMKYRLTDLVIGNERRATSLVLEHKYTASYIRDNNLESSFKHWIYERLGNLYCWEITVETHDEYGAGWDIFYVVTREDITLSAAISSLRDFLCANSAISPETMADLLCAATWYADQLPADLLVVAVEHEPSPAVPYSYISSNLTIEEFLEGIQ